MPVRHFECGVCLEARDEPHEKIRTVRDDNICSECAQDMIPLFEAALINEIDFPPRWGPTEISFDDFEGLFTKDFCLAYRKKVKEYKTPVPERVYCQHKVESAKTQTAGGTEVDFCNTFMGSSQRKGVSQCGGCAGWTCMDCRKIAPSPLYEHICSDVKAESEPDALDKATKGKEWQECPNSACKIKAGLRDGCNVLLCRCGASFCFICGHAAAHDSDHWTEGKPCPRWGGLDAPNSMFDRPGPVDPPQVELNPRDVMIALMRPAIQAAFLEVGEDLYMDNEEVFTLLEEFGAELHRYIDPNDGLPKILLDMFALLFDLGQSLTWILSDFALKENLDLREVLSDPITEAVRTTNFFIRDEILATKFLATLEASLAIVDAESVLREMPVGEIFGRYNEVHKPRYMDALRDEERAAGRTLWVVREDDGVERPRRAFI